MENIIKAVAVITVSLLSIELFAQAPYENKRLEYPVSCPGNKDQKILAGEGQWLEEGRKIWHVRNPGKCNVVISAFDDDNQLLGDAKTVDVGKRIRSITFPKGTARIYIRCSFTCTGGKAILSYHRKPIIIASQEVEEDESELSSNGDF